MSESLHSILEESRNLAIAHGKATLSGDYKAGNVAFDKLLALVPAIRKYGVEGEDALLRLTMDPNDSVVCWAATNLLKSHEEKAITALERIAAKSGIIAFSAKLVIQQWKKGELSIP